MSKRDYYEVLGLQKGSSSDEIRKAYKKIALKDHPDRNPGNAEAEARFKEATEAYTTLSDDEKRAAYDQWGHDGPGMGGGWPGGGGDPFSGFRDIFSEIFGGRGGGGTRVQHDGPERGGDIRIAQAISLVESMKGCSKEITLDLPSNCGTCNGSGAKPGTHRKKCAGCNGLGQVMMRQGIMTMTTTCPQCGGAGDTVDTPCEGCNGVGTVNKKKRLNVSIPAGIDRGQQLRVSGGGLPGKKGGGNGDAFVVVDVLPLEGWQREGDDLITVKSLSYPVATLGGKLSIVLPDGESVELRVKGGTQPGEIIDTPGKGMPRIKNPLLRGKLRVVAQVEVPKMVSPKVRGLLEELGKEFNDTLC